MAASESGPSERWRGVRFTNIECKHLEQYREQKKMAREQYHATTTEVA